MKGLQYLGKKNDRGLYSEHCLQSRAICSIIDQANSSNILDVGARIVY